MLAWLATTDLPWRPAVEFGAIDMSPSYKAAVRTGLPHATGVVDHLHVMQLANKMLNQVRHRLTSSHRGRRGRACDPAWKARRKLLRNREDLDPEQFAAMWNPLWAEGPIGQALLVAWIAKENLRSLLALARTGPDRHRIGHAKWQFLTWCADSDLPEVRQLARTIDRWCGRDRSLPPHRHQQRQERRDQPRDQACRPLRLRLPQRSQPAPPSTLRHHPPGPWTPPPRITSK